MRITREWLNLIKKCYVEIFLSFFFAKEKQKSRQKRLCVYIHNLGLKPEAINIYLLWRYFYSCYILSVFISPNPLLLFQCSKCISVLSFIFSLCDLRAFSVFSRITREWLNIPNARRASLCPSPKPLSAPSVNSLRSLWFNPLCALPNYSGVVKAVLRG